MFYNFNTAPFRQLIKDVVSTDEGESQTKNRPDNATPFSTSFSHAYFHLHFFNSSFHHYCPFLAIFSIHLLSILPFLPHFPFTDPNDSLLEPGVSFAPASYGSLVE